jgi:hypothetical protein
MWPHIAGRNYRADYRSSLPEKRYILLKERLMRVINSKVGKKETVNGDATTLRYQKLSIGASYDHYAIQPLQMINRVLCSIVP